MMNRNTRVWFLSNTGTVARSFPSMSATMDRLLCNMRHSAEGLSMK